MERGEKRGESETLIARGLEKFPLPPSLTLSHPSCNVLLRRSLEGHLDLGLIVRLGSKVELCGFEELGTICLKGKGDKDSQRQRQRKCSD